MKHVFVICVLALASFASATTTTLRLSSARFQENEQGGAAMNFRMGIHKGLAIEEARLNLTTPGSGACVFKLDSRFGSRADAELYRFSPTTTSTLWQPTRPVSLSSADDFTATWPNSGSTTWSLELVFTQY
jgi:hypothetical protein